jgi:hypothetical protein
MEEALGGLTQAEAVDDRGRRKPVERPKAHGHAALSEVLIRRHIPSIARFVVTSFDVIVRTRALGVAVRSYGVLTRRASS